MAALLLLVSLVVSPNVGLLFSLPVAASSTRRDLVPLGERPYGVEIRADAGAECRVAADTSSSSDITIEPCAWSQPVPFSLTWDRSSVVLKVGRTSIRRAADWQVGNAIRLSAAGSARLTITRVENEWSRAIVAGSPSSPAPVDTWISGEHLADGWTITGTLERTTPSALDALVVTVAQDATAPADRQKPLTFTGGSSGPHAPLVNGLPRLWPTFGDPLSASETTRTWTGQASDLWSVASNWRPAGVPASGEVLVFGQDGQNRKTTNNDLPDLMLGGITVQQDGYVVLNQGLTLAPDSVSNFGGRFEVSSLAGAGVVSFGNELHIRQERSTTFGGTFNSTGRLFLESGGGTLTYTGPGRAATTLRSGGLVLDGGVLGETFLEGGTFGANGAAGGAVYGNFTKNSGTYVQSISSRTDFHRLAVNGSVTLNGPKSSLQIHLVASYVPNVGDEFLIVANDGTDGVTNLFGYNNGETVLAGPPSNVEFTIHRDGGDGNDVVLRVTKGGATTSPELAITKGHAADFPKGGVGEYTITVTNRGTGPTVGLVTVTDQLPTGFTPMSVSGVGWACTTTPLRCTRGDILAPGGSYPDITLGVNVAGDAQSGTNVATVTGGGDSTAATASDPTTVVDPGSIDLTIAKVSDPAVFRQGSQAGYVVTVTNNGTRPTTAATTVVDTLPAGVTLRGAPGGSDWNCTGTRTITCIRTAVLAAGASSALRIDINVAADAPTSVSNTASVSGGGTPAGNTTTVITPVIAVAPILVGTKDAVSFTPGQTDGTIGLTVTNEGNGPTVGEIVVTDTLPVGFAPTRGSGDGWTCSIASQVVTCRRSAPLAESAASSIVISVNVANDANSDTNRASVSGGGDGTPFEFTAPITVQRTATDLTIDKSHSGEPTQGQPVVFTITVTNGGQTPSSGEVVVVDTLPAGLTVVSIAGDGWSCSHSSLRCTRSDALGGGVAYPTIAVTANIGLDVTSAVNSATVSGGGDATPGNNTATDTVTVGVVAPDVTIDKVNNGPFTVGQQDATFTVTVRNVGVKPTNDAVTVTDSVPAGLMPTGASGPGWSCDITAQQVACSRSDALAVGVSYPAITIVSTVARTATSATNVATVSGGGDTSGANNAASSAYAVASDTPQPVAVLRLSKSHAADFVQGQTGAVYTLVVSNVGDGPTTDVIRVRDDVPAGLTPTAASGDGWQCEIQGQVVSCVRSAVLEPDAATTLTITVDVAVTATDVVNRATVIGGGDATPGVAEDPTVIVGRPQLTITKSHLDPVLQGQQGLQFVVTVRNNGTAATSEPVTIVDMLPAGLTPVDAVGSGWSCSVGGQTATCSRTDTLGPDQGYAPVYVTADVAANAESTTNTATVSGGGDTTPGDNTAADLVPIASSGQPNLVLTKEHDGDFVTGQLGAVYRLRVDNRGTAESAGAVTVVDSVPAGLLPRSATGGGWNCAIAGQQVSCSRADVLPPAASWPVIHLTVDVAAEPSTVVNSAILGGGGDLTPVDNSASDTTTIRPSSVVPGAPDLAVSKRHQDPFVAGQQGAEYRITVTNVGTAVTIGDVFVTDDVPAGMVPVSAGGDGWSCAVGTPSVVCGRSDLLGPLGSYPDITLVVNVLPTASSIANVVTVRGGGDTKSDNNSDSDFTNVNGAVDAASALSVTSDLLVGTMGEYVARITSLGSGTIAGQTVVITQVADVLVPVAGTGSGWQCQIALQQFRCTTQGTFAPGVVLPDIRLRVLVRAESSEITTRTTVDAEGDVNRDNDSAQVTSSSAIPTSSLRITKAASVDQVAIGGTVTYRVEVANTGEARVASAILADLLPRGFRLVEGESEVQSSTRSLRGVLPSRDADRPERLEWPLGTLSPGETVNVTYRVVVGADARTGRQDNSATVTGVSPVGATVSVGPAIASVDVIPDTFSLLQAVVGRVYEDVDRDGTFTTADRPLAGARVITSTGQASITDPDGQFNIPSLGAGTVAVSLDRSTIPGHLTVAAEGPGDGSWSRLLRTPIGGGSLLRQNFALVMAPGMSTEVAPEVVPSAIAPPPESPLDQDAGPLPPRREYQSREGASMLLALGEVSFGPAAPEFEVFGKDGDVWGYGSVFLQTPVGSPKNRLTLAYDSHRRLNGATGNDRLFELDPNDRMYPVFGDTSQRQEFATANSKFFGRFERGESYVMYGDLMGDLTTGARDGGRWSSYQRHLTGVEVRVANVAGGGVAVRAAQPTTAYARDVFSGSLLGLIPLRHGHVRPGTETIAIEVRDRRLPERILSRVVLARAVDYELEPISGSVFLRRHVGGLDSALNLVQVVATYEYENAGLESMILSGRGTWAYKGLRIGGGFFTEEGVGDGRFTVGGVDLEQRLPRGGRLTVEVPYSTGSAQVARAVDTQPIGQPAASEGFGVQFEVDQPFAFWRGRAIGRGLGADRGFQNPFSSTITPGARYLTGGVELSPRAPSTLRLGATDEAYALLASEAQRTTISASWSETIANRLTLTAGYDQRWLDREPADVDSAVATAAARFTLGSRFEASAAREQNVGAGDDPTYPDQTMLGARLSVTPDTSLFYRHRISDDPIVPVGDFAGTGLSAIPTTSEFSVGVESRVADTTQLTSRYEIDQGISGPDAFAVMGVVTQLGLWRGFTGTVGAERGELMSGAGKDYTSGTLGVSYVGSRRFKASARYEARSREGFASLLTTGIAARMSGGVTGLFRADWLAGDDPVNVRDSLAVLGAVAIRPVTSDRAGLLFSYQFVDRDGVGTVVPGTEVALGWRHRLSADGYLQPAQRLELLGKFVWQESGIPEPFVHTYLAQGRAQFTLMRYLDAAIEGRYIRQPATNSDRRGAAAELGVWPIADFRAAIGYSFYDTRDSYGRDLEGRAKGFYFTLSTKLSRLFNLMGSAPPQAAASR